MTRKKLNSPLTHTCSAKANLVTLILTELHLISVSNPFCRENLGYKVAKLRMNPVFFYFLSGFIKFISNRFHLKCPCFLKHQTNANMNHLFKKKKRRQKCKIVSCKCCVFRFGEVTQPHYTWMNKLIYRLFAHKWHRANSNRLN